MLDILFPLFDQCASRTKNRTIPHISSESPAFVVFLSLISYNQFCSQSEYQMKLYESNRFQLTKTFLLTKGDSLCCYPLACLQRCSLTPRVGVMIKEIVFTSHSYGCVISPVDQFFVFSHLPKKIEPIN